ncbi:cation:proton antiporter [Sulfurimonas sp.]|uniref:cation:proton antiporter n=1 Tax=Sulfurimonas sp. TaxID=2022749 RepID=UPI002B4A1130|nr:cation:proton antiporter [Sulfurimonas sp.]
MSIIIITLVVLGYGYYSKFLLGLNISGPMVFTVIGVFLSPIGIDLVEINLDTHIITIVAEIALVIILFSDASSLKLSELKSEWSIPFRLLFIGLPLTIAFSTFIATIIFTDESIIYLFLMALLLAPTDAALGKAVVLDKRVPQKIRDSINIESGLNDGIVFPMLLGVIALVTLEKGISSDINWFIYIAQQIIFGAGIGALVGYINALVSTKTMNKDRVESAYKNLIPVAIAVFAYYSAEYFGGNGFIAAFFAGIFLGNYNKKLRGNVENFVESESELLILISFMVFGLTFIPQNIEFMDFKVLLYSLLSLTVLRMIPVAISLIGAKLNLATVAFIGWFGPRGIASILYIFIVVDEVISIKTHETIYAVVTLTILLSIFLHGLSTRPLISLYSRKNK